MTRRGRWKPVFLQWLANTGNISEAARMANIDRHTAYDHRAKDQAFAQAWESARQQGAEVLEREARRRALEGVLRKRFTPDGQPIIDPATGEQYAELEYSDTLLIFLLKGARPGTYREHRHHSSDGTFRAAPAVLLREPLPRLPYKSHS